MAAVAVPVLILQGDCHVAFSSEELAAAVDSFTGSIELESHNIVGGAPMLWTTHADIVNNYLFDFLTRRVAALPPSNVVKPLDLGYALNQAAAIARSDRIKLRNSRLPESFSQRSTEEKVERAEKIESLRKSAAECKLRIPGSTDKETWVLEAAPLTSRPRRRWRYASLSHFLLLILADPLPVSAGTLAVTRRPRPREARRCGNLLRRESELLSSGRKRWTWDWSQSRAGALARLCPRLHFPPVHRRLHMQEARGVSRCPSSRSNRSR